jgi:quercetin dioxygenase-like cupin family protein
MKSLTFAACLLLASGAFAAGGPVLMPATDVRWSPVPDAPGVQIRPCRATRARASHFFLKFAGGFSAPLHHHTANHYVTVVAGTVVLVVDGKEHRFGPGSYFSFAGKKTHATRCEAGADCVLAMDARGPWDVVPAAKAGGR